MVQEFRTNIDVLVRLAHAFHEIESWKKTHLFSASRTNWHSFVRYINWLISKNYVEPKIEGTDELYKVTRSGREMFDMILKLHEHVRKAKLLTIK